MFFFSITQIYAITDPLATALAIKMQIKARTCYLGNGNNPLPYEPALLAAIFLLYKKMGIFLTQFVKSWRSRIGLKF